MAYATTESIEELTRKGVYIPGDDPYGLFRGEAGRAWSWAVLSSGSDMGMIGFSDV